MHKKKIFIYGKHGNRIPFSYAVYRQYFLHHFEYVDQPEKAEYLIVGFTADLRDNIKYLYNLVNSCRGLKLVVFSEEPLWDTLWSGGFHENQGYIRGKVNDEDIQLDYYILNHFTSKIFDFEYIPYFITTSNDYFVRYSNIFSRNAKLKMKDFMDIWQRAHIRYAFFAEKRLEQTYVANHNNGTILGLSQYRTQIAMQMELDSVMIKGEGWNRTLKRQSLPDWHLDKLTTLDGQSYMVSALENTHCSNYITEKLFDAFAVKSIPLYYAQTNHAVFRLVDKNSFINLAGLSVEESFEKIVNFKIDSIFSDAYLETQIGLNKLFSDPNIYLNERKRVVYETVKAFSKF